MSTYSNSPTYWDLRDLSPVVKAELNRRSKVSTNSFNYSTGVDINSPYTHPMAAWVRVCSNSSGNDAIGKNGFILGGMTTSGFNTTYGLTQNSSGRIIGYSATGEPHVLVDEKYKNRPAPGIISIDSELNGGNGKFKIVTVKWSCWSLDQLNYLTPYFLTNGVSMCVEFGWNNVNKSSLLPISNSTNLLKYFYNDTKENIQTLINDSLGNYDGSMGIISDFDYSFRSDGGFDCTTVIKNIGGFYSGVYSSGRSSNQTNDPESKTKEFRTFMRTSFNAVEDLAKRKHNGSNLKDTGNIFSSQVFYKRDNLNIDRINSQGSPAECDFDKSTDNWWISIGYLVEIFNKKCAVKSGMYEILKINIDNTVISANPNLTSKNGNVLLIPSTVLPQFEIFSSENDAVEFDIQENDPDLKKANEILKSRKSFFLAGGKNNVSVARINANDVINWWSSNKDTLAFPAKITDSRIKSKYYNGYLKNLYVSKKVILDAVESCNTYKDTILTILNQVSDAAGGLWQFDIVPLDPSGNDNSTMTIIDINCLNGFNPLKIYDFKVNQISSIMKSVNFNVKSSNAVTVQTLLSGGSKSNGIDNIKANVDGVSQDHRLSVSLMKNDRLIKEVTPVESKLEVETADKESRLELINRRIPAKESSDYFFYTKNNKITYLLAEPEDELHKGLLYGNGNENPTTYSAVQPGITLEFVIQGLSGIMNLDSFTVSELPSPYGDKCFFQVQNVKHSVANGNWQTTVVSAVRLKPAK